MKKLHLLLLLTMCAVGTMNAQTTTVINLTTGQGNTAAGNPDPHWTVQTNPSGGFNAALVANPIPPYALDSCGQWISLSPLGAGNTPHGTGSSSRSFTYRYQFLYHKNGCNNISATIDLSFIAADNSVSSMTFNNQPVPNAPSPGFLPGQTGALSENISALLADGLNTLDVTVDNSNLSTAMQICGEIRIDYGCVGCYYEAPQNLTCTSYNSFDWDDVNGALGYRIEILYNDMPRCCTWEDIENPWSPAPVYIDVLTGQSNYVLALPDEPCFSWRVAPLCYDQPSSPFSFGPWSDYACSCTETVWLKHEGSEKDKEPGKASIYPNPTTGTFSINTSGYDHFYYKVTDISGRIIIGLTFSHGSSLDVDLSDQANGTYFITIEHGGTSEVVKLVKQD